METALISLVSVALVIIATVTMTMTSFHSASILADSWKEMEQQAGDIRRTEIDTEHWGEYTGGDLELRWTNVGQTDLAQFANWDVIVQYEDGTANYTNYTTNNPPGNNQWTVEGIYLSDNSTEVFDPNILNPDERMKAVVNIDPDTSQGDWLAITVATPNGVTSQSLVQHE